MKRLLITIFTLSFLVPLLCLAYTSPGNPQGFVNDFAHVLTADQVQTLESKLSSFEQQTSNEIAVVTVPTIGDDTIENYAVTLFQEWGIGKKVHDNGILLLVAVDDHRMRIEVGYGLEGAVTDAMSSSIIRNILTPAFKNNDFYGGINAATDKLMAASQGEYTIDENTPTGLARHIGSGTIIFAFYLLLWIASVLARSRSWWAGGVVGAVLSVIVGFIFQTLLIGLVSFIFLVPFGLLFDFIVSRGYSQRVASGSKRFPWWMGGGPGGGFGGGRGGGGFGGFGGGRSGGGGASGSW